MHHLSFYDRENPLILSKFVFVLLLAAIPAALSAATQVDLTTPSGEISPFTLVDHPRLFLDGPSGELTLRLKDPDGSGPLKAPAYNTAAGAALRYQVGYWYKSRETNLDGTIAVLAAMGWFMNNTERLPNNGEFYRDIALYQIRNLEKVMVNLGACDQAANFCGTSVTGPITHADYLGMTLVNWAFAYTLMRSELTPAERLAFSQKVLNGISPDIMPTCENRLVQIPGSYKGVQTSKFNFILTANSGSMPSLSDKWIFVKDAANPTLTGQYAEVTSKTSAQMTITAYPTAYLMGTNIHMYEVAPWTPKSCGYGKIANTHPNLPTYAAIKMGAKLASATSETATTLSLTAAVWPTSDAGFYITLGSGTTQEVVFVTRNNGTSVEVKRGLFSTVAKAWPSATLVDASLSDSGGDEMGWNNRTLTRQIAHWTMALVLADDHPLAPGLLKKTVAYWKTNVWDIARAYFTTINTAGSSYALSRELPFLTQMVHSLRVSTREHLDYGGKWLYESVVPYILYWRLPWKPDQMMAQGIGSVACDPIKPDCWTAPLFAAYMFAGEAETPWLNQLARSSGAVTDQKTVQKSVRGNIAALLFGEDTANTRSDFASMPTHRLAVNTGDDDVNSRTNMSALISRSDWTTTASIVALLAPDYGVHNSKLVLSEKFTDRLPGHYVIGKTGWLVGDGDDEASTMYFGRGNHVDVGDTARLPRTPFPDPEITQYAASDGSDKYVYARVDNTTFYEKQFGVTLASRALLHVKADSSNDIVAVSDSVRSTKGQRIRSLTHFPNNGGAGEGVTSIAEPGRVVTANTGYRTVSTYVSRTAGMNLSDVSVEGTPTSVTIGPDCTAAVPCRITGAGRAEYVLTAPILIPVTPATTGSSTLYIWWSWQNRQFLLKPTSVGATSVGSDVRLAAGAEAVQSGDIVMGEMKWTAGKHSTSCPGYGTGSWGSTFHHCLPATERHVYFENNRTQADADWMVVHETCLKAGSCGAARQVADSTILAVELGGAQPFVIGSLTAETTSVRLTSTHAGLARYYLMGVANGTYEILVNGAVVGPNVTAANDAGILVFQAPSGRVEVRQR